MGRRAPDSGISLDATDASMVKAMLKRGDRQHDIAAWFGVNGGRVAQVATGAKFADVDPAPSNILPPPGPYLSGRRTAALLEKARLGGLDLWDYLKPNAKPAGRF